MIHIAPVIAIAENSSLAMLSGFQGSFAVISKEEVRNMKRMTRQWEVRAMWLTALRKCSGPSLTLSIEKTVFFHQGR